MTFYIYNGFIKKTKVNLRLIKEFYKGKGIRLIFLLVEVYATPFCIL